MTALTLSAKSSSETSETDETYTPARNGEFLAAIFDGLEEPLRPFFLGFPGSPQDRKGWGGAAWNKGAPADGADMNWYFTLATYAPVSGGYARQEKHCAAIFGVMLDDLGTKAKPRERLDACPPSYLIETSLGNYQAGYLFAAPQMDVKRVSALNQAMVVAGLCDPGAKSPATRYGRMPFASNGKTTPAFPCRLVEWHPERRYSIEQIAEGLELVLAVQGRKKLKTQHSKADLIDAHADDIHIPRPNENPVVAELQKRGIYKRPLGDGRHDVTCPWVHEHTDRIDHGSAYFEPSDLYPVGGFKCQHASCGARRIGALLEFLGVGFTAAKHKPTIRVQAGDLHRIVDAAERELAATGRYFQRGGLVVGIATDPQTQDAQIKPLSAPALTAALSSVATWERYDARAENFVVSDPPQRHVGVLFDASAYSHLPPLAGLARQPYLRPDGSLCRDSGYDAPTQLFGLFDAREFNTSPTPSRADAERDLALLRELLVEFEFDAASDETATLAAILTAAVRPALATAPMFHVKAATYGSGKSFLTGLVSLFASAERPGVLAYPATDEEASKLLLARLLAGPATLTFDNLKGDLLPHESMCSALTEPFLTGRILGVSKTATVGTRCLFLSSGNNVDAIRDMTRRVLTIVLNPRCETPASRTFQRNPQRVVEQSRARYVSAALTIIRAWIVAGQPRSASKPWASFGQWSDWCREPLLWLGMPDPAARVFGAMATDPDRETLGRLLAAWRRVFDARPAMVRDAAAHTDSDLREVIAEIAEERGEVNRRRLGRWIARHQSRIVDGLEFRKEQSSTSAERWRVAAAAPKTSVISVSEVLPTGLAQSVSDNASQELPPAAVEDEV